MVEALRRGEDIEQFENRHLCGDGSFRWLQWNRQRLPDKGLLPGSRVYDALVRHFAGYAVASLRDRPILDVPRANGSVAEMLLVADFLL